MKNLSTIKLFGLSVFMLIVGAISFIAIVSFGLVFTEPSNLLIILGSLSIALFSGGLAGLISAMFKGISGK